MTEFVGSLPEQSIYVGDFFGNVTRLEYRIIPVGQHSPSSYTVSNPFLAAVTPDGVLTGNGNGTIKLVASYEVAIPPVSLPFTFSGIVSDITPDPDSVRYAASNEIDSRISGSPDPDTVLPYFSSIDDSTATYDLNPDFWASDLDLTCITLRYSGDGTSWTTKACGALISPNALITAAHAGPIPNGYYRFKGSDGVVQTVQVDNGWAISGTDIALVKLKTSLTSAVTPALLLPSNFADYLPDIGNGSANGVPGMGLGQDQDDTADFFRGYVREIGTMQNDTFLQEPSTTARQALSSSIISGDSGSPQFIILKAPRSSSTPKLILLGTIHNGGAGDWGAFPDLADYIDAINDACDAHGCDRPTVADLTGYNNYDGGGWISISNASWESLDNTQWENLGEFS